MQSNIENKEMDALNSKNADKELAMLVEEHEKIRNNILEFKIILKNIFGEMLNVEVASLSDMASAAERVGEILKNPNMMTGFVAAMGQQFRGRMGSSPGYDDAVVVVTRSLAAAGIVSAQDYIAQNPDVGASGMDPVLHFLLWGAAEGRRTRPETRI